MIRWQNMGRTTTANAGPIIKSNEAIVFVYRQISDIRRTLTGNKLLITQL